MILVIVFKNKNPFENFKNCTYKKTDLVGLEFLNLLVQIIQLI